MQLNVNVTSPRTDFDGDDMISKDDLQQVIQRLTGDGQQLSEDDMEQLMKNVCFYIVTSSVILDNLYLTEFLKIQLPASHFAYLKI